MNGKLVIVTGYFGAPVKETAQNIAGKRELPLIDLDRLVEEREGRPIRKMVMMLGEHQYRNHEYALLKELSRNGQPAVVFCGDGVLHDTDSRAIIDKNELVIVGDELTEDQLWAKASLTENSYHAFMSMGTETEKREAFNRLIQRQKILFGGKQ